MLFNMGIIHFLQVVFIHVHVAMDTILTPTYSMRVNISCERYCIYDIDIRKTIQSSEQKKTPP